MAQWTVHMQGVLTRFYRASVVFGHKLYCFGGDIYHRGQIDVHVFDTLTFSWTLPSETVGGEGRGERPAHVPSFRCHHTAVLIGHTVYVWGGEDCRTRRCCNTLYTFDVDTHRWFKPRDSGVPPAGRYGHSACALGQVMYIHGGYINSRFRCTNEINTLDTRNMVWTLINTSGPPAHATICHSGTIIGTKMFVFGGVGHPLGGMRAFDTMTGRWSSYSLRPLKDYWTHSSGHSAFAYNGELYIFGYICGVMSRNIDQEFLWKFNPETGSWKNLQPKGTKGPNSNCHPHAVYSFLVGDCVFTFWGQCGSVDLFVLDLSPSLKTLCKLAVTQYGLEQSELPREIRLELAAMNTNRGTGKPWNILHT